MITTFDVARWAVRGTLLTALLRAILGVFDAPLLLILPGIAGFSNLGLAKNSLLAVAPDLIYFGILLLLSDLLANIVVGGEAVTRELLNEARQLRSMLPGLIGLLLILPAVPSLLLGCFILAADLANHAWNWPNLWINFQWSASRGAAISYHQQIITIAPALLRVFAGAALLFWRRARQVVAPVLA